MSKKKIAYLGPAGTFTEQAAIKFDPKVSRIAFDSFREVLESVQKKKVDAGVIAIENVIHGMVRENFDYMYNLDLKVQAERVIPIHHALIGSKKAKYLKRIYAHPQALAQCRNYLHKNFPKAELVPAASNVAGMVEVAQGKTNENAAIGPALAAQQYGLQILVKDIQDQPGNVTRFWLVGRELIVKPEHDKFSIAYYFERDVPGCLYESLGFFARENINLISLAVRPSTRELGNYVFHLDLAANLHEERVKFALDGLERITDVMKVLGSYKAAK